MGPFAMTPQTEAACLLGQGALYHERVGLLPVGGDPIFAGFKRAAFSLYYGDSPIFHFDLEGRWQRAFVEGIHYLKAPDASVQAIDRVRVEKNLVLRRKVLAFAEATDFDGLVRDTAIGLIDDLGAGRLERDEPPANVIPLSSDALRAFLERIAQWDAAAWFAHREAYLATYGPLPFLPPDCQNAVILQATLGHADGLTFGGGPAAEHYVRSASEFQEHVQAVSGLLGRRILQCRGVFLGGSDLLRRPEDEVVGYLQAIRGTFAGNPDASARDEVHAFLDDFSPPRPDAGAFRRFRDHRLHRISLGVESGDPSIRSLYGKSWADEDLAAVVAGIKTAHLALSLVVLVGAGGEENAEGHVEATGKLITSLSLGRGDIVALLDAEEVRSSKSPLPLPLSPRETVPEGRVRGSGFEEGTALDFTPLSGRRLSDQHEAIKGRLQPLRTTQGVKVVSYSLEKQMI